MRRQGMTAPAVAAVLGCSARKVRELCEGESLDPPPEPAPTKARRKPPRRKAPRAFKRRNQPALGRMLPPIILDASPRLGVGGFGLAAQAVSASGLGPNVPIGGQDEFGRVKVGEKIVDMGTTLSHDEKRYAASREADAARNDDSWDAMEIPDDAERVVREHEDGSLSELNLRTLEVREL